ncbi:hypothetical protein ACFLXC_05090 [Chloroflexota bacterium]
MAKDKPEGEKQEKKLTGEGDMKMVGEDRPRKIMTQPLPQILDEIEDSIRAADEAAKDARNAAEEARMAGEKAANEAAMVAANAIARVEDIARESVALAELIKLALVEASNVLQKRLNEGK